MTPEYRPTARMDAWEVYERKLKKAREESETIEEYNQKADKIYDDWEREKQKNRDTLGF